MKVILLDRDGTLIVDPPDECVDSLAKIVLYPDTISALKLLADHGFAAVLVTNQAGIAEGRISQAEFGHINDEVVRQLTPSGLTILSTFVCPHGPDDGCDCRKPSPKMLEQAGAEFELDMPETYMIGDRSTDVAAGQSAGCRTILVHSTPGSGSSSQPTFRAPNLLTAAQYVIEHP